MNNHTAFANAPNERTQIEHNTYAQSLSGLITTVVMTSLSIYVNNFARLIFFPVRPTSVQIGHNDNIATPFRFVERQKSSIDPIFRGGR